jgi:hypothetical protein
VDRKNSQIAPDLRDASVNHAGWVAVAIATVSAHDDYRIDESSERSAQPVFVTQPTENGWKRVQCSQLAQSRRGFFED